MVSHLDMDLITLHISVVQEEMVNNGNALVLTQVTKSWNTFPDTVKEKSQFLIIKISLTQQQYCQNHSKC